MNSKNILKYSPIDTSYHLMEYIKEIKKGTNKVSVQSIRKLYKSKNFDLMKLELDKLPKVGQRDSIESSVSEVIHFPWNLLGLIQIEIPDEGRRVVYSLQSDKHTMIEHRNVLDNGYILWFYFNGPWAFRDEAIDVLSLYLEDQYDLKLNLDKFKDSDFQLEMGYDPKIYTNPHATAFNFKYLKKKYESRKQEVA